MVTYLCALLRSLGLSHSGACSLYCHIMSSLYITHNSVFHEHTKHIEIDYHYIRDAIQEGLLVMSHVFTTEQLADLFTKALGTRQFHYLLGKLGISDPYAPTWGGGVFDCMCIY